MPKHAPSPHRFLAGGGSSTKKPRPQPPSNLRHGFTAQTPKANITNEQLPEASVHKVTPAKRFVIAPINRSTSDGGIAKSKERDNVIDEGWQATQTELQEHPQLTPRPRLGKKLHRVESIHDGSQEQLPELVGIDGLEGDSNIAESIEHPFALSSDQDAPQTREEDERQANIEDAEMLFTPRNPKRRRLSPQPPSSPTRSTSRNLLSPQTPISNTTSAPTQPPTTVTATSSHRFLVPAPKTPAPTVSTTPAPSRPVFLLPRLPPSPQKSTTPLPETFSPSRKGQKYIPGGLASTLQSWIIETASTGYQAQIKDTVLCGGDKEDGVKMKVRVLEVRGASGTTVEVECFSGSWAFVRGETDAWLYNASRAPSGVRPDGGVWLLLAGQGSARGSGGVRVKVGSVIGVRTPMWDVDVKGEEEKCVVSVDWILL